MSLSVGRAVRYTTLIILYIAALLLVIMFAPLTYNYYISPLGQLYQSLEVGESYEKVKEKFSSYYEERKSVGHVKFIASDTDTDIMTQEKLNIRSLYVYDFNIFDDLQLQVLFNEGGKADRINFIGD